MLTHFSRNSELQRERAWARIHLVPALLAENDRDIYRREQAALVREKEIMKDVKGWEVRLSFLSLPLPLSCSSSLTFLSCAPLAGRRQGVPLEAVHACIYRCHLASPFLCNTRSSFSVHLALALSPEREKGSFAAQSRLLLLVRSLDIV